MNLSRPFINRPVLTTLLMFSLVMFGIMSYKSLGVAAIPDLQFPTIEVSVSYPGASAQEMAERVATPLERQFMNMQGINFVASSNSYGSSTIILNFHQKVNINIAAQETQNAIQKANAELPKDLPNNPSFTKINPSDTPVLYLVIPSPVISKSTLYQWGQTFLAQQLSTVNGVGSMEVFGTPYAIRAYIDPQKIAARNISMQEVSTAIKSATPYQPTGKFYGPQTSITTISQGQLLKASEYNKIIVKYQDNQPVRIEDLGYCIDDVLNNKQTMKWVTSEYPDGENIVFITILREMGYNTIKLCDDIIAKLKVLKTQIPNGIKVLVPFTLSKWITQAIADVKFTLLISFILVIIIVFFYLGKLGNTIIPVLALPITICGTFIFMKLFGYSIDIFTLSALTVAMGFLIDDAIVVLENIVRTQQTRGDLNPYQAALLGAKQIIIPVVAISLCLVAIFVPVLFLPGPVGQIFNAFSAVVIIAVLYSAFISLSLTPMLCSRFVHEYNSDKKTKMEKISDKINNKGLKVYERFLVKALEHRFLMLIIGLISFILSLFFFVSMPKEFLPEYDLGVIQCFAQARQGTSPQEMQRITHKLLKRLNQQKYQFGLGAITATPTDNQALFFINLIDSKKRPNIQECMKIYQKIFDDEINLQISQKPFPLINLSIGGTDASKAKYQYLVQSYKQDELYTDVQKLLNAMKSSSKFSVVTSNLMIDSPTYNIELDRNRSHSYGGINAMDIENNLKLGYAESYVATMNAPQNLYYVILELTKPYFRHPSDINALYIKNNKDQVAMSQIAKGKLISKPQTVNHINTLNAITVQFDTAPGVALSEAITDLDTLSKKTLRPTVIAKVAGNLQAFESSLIAFTLLILLSFLVVYIVLGMLYENFLYPIVPLSVLPLAFFGGLFTLFIFGQTISIFALVGLLMLIGIVLKNGILLIDFALEEKMRGINRSQAMYNAAITRFRPILMTTLAALVGAVPIALGIGGSAAQGRAPLGIVVVGGLIFSQLITLFITPAVYLYIDKYNDTIKKKYKVFQDKAK
jgi:hydrophobic/amphiphilic exporter-1 (mainly G- bacteria), HAE1 family